MDIQSMTKNELIDELAVCGVKLHPNTGIKKLQDTLSNLQVSNSNNDEEIKMKTITETKPKETPKGVVLTQEQAAMRLVRIVVRSNNPNQTEKTGAIFSVGSSIINKGRSVRKYVPFNNEEGWHVPHMLYQHILNSECQIWKTVKDRSGNSVRTPHRIKAYNVELLPPLTGKELHELADRQKAANNLG